MVKELMTCLRQRVVGDGEQWFHRSGVLVRFSSPAVKVRHEHEELQGEAEVTALFEHSQSLLFE